MRPWALMLAFAVVAIGAASGGYFLRGDHQSATSPSARKIVYYRNPMGQPDTSPVPKKDSMGMDYIPVYADETQPSPQTPASSNEKGRILYYRNPMGQPDTSPVPKKDSMGMDYIPVYENEAMRDSGSVSISPDRIQQLGVRSEPVEMRSLARVLQSVGTVQADERKFSVVTTKFDGWIETLDVDATGQAVRRGQALMEVYAPELVSAQQEYLLASRSLLALSAATPDVQNSAKELAAASLQRLRNWDISADQMERLSRDGTVTRTLALRAPTSGVVIEKTAVAGMHFTAGETLYRIADLSSVWVIADVFEQDLGQLRPGQSATVTVDAYAGASFPGKVDFIYPTVTQETRTAKLRVVIANPGGRLKPGMYAKISFEAPVNAAPVLAVPDAAVLDSGNRQIVLVDMGQGRFQPRQVKLGARAGGYTAVEDGVKQSETVVVGANFLIDAESNLRAALQNFAPPEVAQGSAP